MAATKIKLYIAGVEYSIIAEDDVKYVQELGRDLDRALTKIMKESPRLSTTQAAVLAALSYADECKKASDSADRLREQIKDYLDDASNAKSKADWARFMEPQIRCNDCKTWDYDYNLFPTKTEDGKTIFLCSDCVSNHKHLHWCKTCGEPFIDKSLPKGKIYQCKDCRGKMNDNT